MAIFGRSWLLINANYQLNFHMMGSCYLVLVLFAFRDERLLLLSVIWLLFPPLEKRSAVFRFILRSAKLEKKWWVFFHQVLFKVSFKKLSRKSHTLALPKRSTSSLKISRLWHVTNISHCHVRRIVSMGH